MKDFFLFLAYWFGFALMWASLWLGTLLLGWLSALCLRWVSDTSRSLIAGIVGSIGGVAASVGIVYGLFKFVFGFDSFNRGDLVFFSIPLAITVFKDLIFALRIQDTVSQIESETVLAFAKPDLTTSWAIFIGHLIGATLAYLWFFLVLAVPEPLPPQPPSIPW